MPPAVGALLDRRPSADHTPRPAARWFPNTRQRNASRDTALMWACRGGAMEVWRSSGHRHAVLAAVLSLVRSSGHRHDALRPL